MALSLRLPNDSLVLKAYASLVGAAPGSTAFGEHKAFIAANGANAYVSALNSLFASVSNAEMATAIRGNLGLTSIADQATTEAFLALNAGNRVGAIFAIADQLASTTDASLAAAKAAYLNGIEASYNYSVVATNYQGATIASLTAVAASVELTTGLDKLPGTSGVDFFNAYVIDNANTLQSGDVIDGAAGLDTLFAEIGNSAKFAISAKTVSVETIKLQAQATPVDATNGNNTSGEANVQNTVQIDAQKMEGVTTWHNSNSRADLIIEDVRIADGAKTKDVTIVMESTDPGNVDFGVYFDQHSLRNTSTGNTTLTIQLMDTGAAATPATASQPLLNNPYDQFKLGINGVLTTIQLDKTAVAAAETYEALLTVFQNALAGTGVVATLGSNFTVTDPLSNTSVTGKSIVLTGGQGVAITAPTGSGWYNTTSASVPPASNIYTKYSDTALTQTELVTSTIVLDDVGRGSTGGDLVVGGRSVGATSDSRGVERFEIEVRDNSKLQTINSTNDALREVTIKNGVTTNTEQNAANQNSSVYEPTVSGKGNLTVNGNANTINPVQGQSTKGSGSDTALAGLDSLHHANTGFTDVRLIDASAMTGKLAFTAAITNNSIKKYIDLQDAATSPTADVAGTGNVNYNVKGANFDYRGGANDDTMVVTIDGSVTASRSTVVSGQSDFTFNVEGGAGNDAITLKVINTAVTGAGGITDWYNNQNLNNNITINAGEGNDTIRIPGAGDVTINAGAGNDVVFSDNTGSANYSLTGWVNNSQDKGAWVFNTSIQGGTSVAQQDLNDLRSDSNDTYNLYKAKLQVTFKGLTSKEISLANTVTYKLTDLEINQAIKEAINKDAVLSKLLVAKDGPANTLVVESLIDGVMNTGNLGVAITLPTAGDLTATEVTAITTAWGLAAGATAANIVTDMTNGTFTGTAASIAASYSGAATGFTAKGSYTTDMATNGVTDIVGAASTTTSDNFITPGTGDDLIVLGTTVGVSLDTSSNEVITYEAAEFGNDVIVNFAVAGMGQDHLNFAAMGITSAGTVDNGVTGAATLGGGGGSGLPIAGAPVATVNNRVWVDDYVTLTTDTVATENDDATNVKELFTDGVVATKSVYVSVTTGNVGHVYYIVDGTAANDLTVTKLGSIDLADTNWSTLTAIGSFVAPSVTAEGPVVTGGTLDVATATTLAPAAGTYSLSDVGTAFAAAAAPVLNNALNITATTAANVANALAIDGASNTGVNSYAVADTMLAATGRDFTTNFVGNTGVTLSGSTGTAETVTGSANADTFTLGGGDAVTPGAGADTLIFGGVGVNTVATYSVADDSIQLSKAAFAALGVVGALTAAEFESGPALVAAATAAGRVVYNTTSGALYYDADGTGGGAAVQIGAFTGAPALVLGEFSIIA